MSNPLAFLRDIPPIGSNGLVDPRWLKFFANLGMLPGMAKAWAYVTVSGGVYTLQDSFNIASITRIAAGRCGVTLQKPFATVNWSSFVAINALALFTGTVSQTATSIELQAFTSGAVLTDPGSYSFVAYGNQ